MSEVETKSIFKSKVFWVNVLTGIGTIAGLGIFPPAVMVYVPAVQAVVNIGLRLITNQPVHVMPK